MSFRLVAAILTVSSVAMAEPASAPEPLPLNLGVALRGGVHHTHVEKGDGEPDGWGPRLELEASIRPVEYLRVGAVGNYSDYDSGRLYASIDLEWYEIGFRRYSAGARAYVQPHRRVFAGVGLLHMWERERVVWLTGGRPTSSQWNHQNMVELIAGANVLRLGNFLVQVAGTYTGYSQYHELEHVRTYGLMLGLAR